MSRNKFLWKVILGLLVIGWAVPNTVRGQDDEPSADDLIAEARQHLGSEEYGEAAKLLKKATEVDEESALAWQLLGYALHADGKLDEAIKAHEEAATFRETKAIANYNLCCAYSLKKDKKKALKYMKAALDAGFNNFDHVDGDSDIDFIRDDEDFKKLMAKAQGEDDDEADHDDDEADADENEPLDAELGERFQEASE